MGIAVAINTIPPFHLLKSSSSSFLPYTSTTACAMEQEDKAETTSFVPVIERLDLLDLLVEVLEEKHSSGSPAPDCRRTLSSALQEVKHKGTLLDRLALLEKRVLQLSVEIEEGNTSKSSSWTVEVSETINGDKDSEVFNSSPKKKDESIGGRVTAHQLQPQVRTASSSSADGFGKDTKSGGQKRNPRKSGYGCCD